jgi:hypothetical protein
MFRQIAAHFGGCVRNQLRLLELDHGLHVLLGFFECSAVPAIDQSNRKGCGELHDGNVEKAIQEAIENGTLVDCDSKKVELIKS